MKAEGYKKIIQIDILFGEVFDTYVAQIQAKGLTAYGESSEEAVGKVLRMLSIAEKSP